MYRTATIAAYDVLDQVFVTATVRTYEADGEGFETREFHCAVTTESLGRENDARWLGDALVSLLEVL